MVTNKITRSSVLILLVGLLRAGVYHWLIDFSQLFNFTFPCYSYRIWYHSYGENQKDQIRLLCRDLPLLGASHQVLCDRSILKTVRLLLKSLRLLIHYHIHRICSFFPRLWLAQVFPLYGKIFFYTKNQESNDVP